MTTLSMAGGCGKPVGERRPPGHALRVVSTVMGPLVALAVVLASAVGLLLFRREALASRQALSELRSTLGGELSGGLISYPMLRFELAGHPAWIGATLGGFGDRGGPGSSTLCRIEVDLPARNRKVWSATELAAMTDGFQAFDSKRHRAVLDSRYVTVEVDGVCEDAREYSAMVAIARTLLDAGPSAAR